MRNTIYILIFSLLPFCVKGQLKSFFQVGLEGYAWTRTPKTDSIRAVSSGNLILNPTVGWVIEKKSKNTEEYINFGFEAVYHATSISIGKERAMGTFSLPIYIGYRNQSEDLFAWHIKLGYQLNWMDLYKINKNIDRSHFRFSTYFFELGRGLANDKYQKYVFPHIYYRMGWGLHNAWTVSLGLRIGTDWITEQKWINWRKGKDVD